MERILRSATPSTAEDEEDDFEHTTPVPHGLKTTPNGGIKTTPGGGTWGGEGNGALREEGEGEGKVGGGGEGEAGRFRRATIERPIEGARKGWEVWKDQLKPQP